MSTPINPGLPLDLALTRWAVVGKQWGEIAVGSHPLLGAFLAGWYCRSIGASMPADLGDFKDSFRRGWIEAEGQIEIEGRPTRQAPAYPQPDKQARWSARYFEIGDVRRYGDKLVAKLKPLDGSDIDEVLRYMRDGAKLWVFHNSVLGRKTRTHALIMGLYDERAQEVLLDPMPGAKFDALLTKQAFISVASDLVQSIASHGGAAS